MLPSVHSTHPFIPEEAWCRPLLPEDKDQGDPFVLEVPNGRAAFRYYAYTTFNGERDEEGCFPAYGSNDLVQWSPLTCVLPTSIDAAYWAPCVLYLPSLERPFVMLYSRSIGTGRAAHIGHRIYRADSLTPEGPFLSSEQAVTPETCDFAIDPDVFRHNDGMLRLTFAMDYVSGERIGTGLAEAIISEDLTTLLSEPLPIARATSDWHVFEESRSMPWKTIPGVKWEEGGKVRWHCIEGPVTLLSPLGQRVTLYSGGCYENFYGVGILKEEQGKLNDYSPTPKSALLRPLPERQLFAPGHCSCIVGPDDCTYVVFHARYGSLAAVRQMSIVPLLWDPKGNPYCPIFVNG